MNMIIGWDRLQRHPAVGHPNRYISVSRIETFEQCELKFWHGYVDKTETEDDTDTSKADVGHVVHDTNDRVYQWVMAEEFSGIIPDQVIMDSFREAYRKSERGLKGVASYEEVLSLSKGYFDRYPDIDHWDILSTEKEFLVNLAPGVDAKGFMDLVLKEDDETVEIVDYKTNAFLFSEEDLKTSLQAGLYLAIAKVLWPWAKRFKFRFEMLRHNKAQIVVMSSEKLDLVTKYLVDITHHMEREWPTWPANPNIFCGWCRYRNKCKTFQSLKEQGNIIARTESESDLLGLSKERERIYSTTKILDKRKKEIDKVLKAKMHQDGLTQLRLGETVYKTIDISSTAYPTEEAVPILSKYTSKSETEIFAALNASITKNKLDLFIGELNLPKSKRTMLTMELLGVADVVPLFSRFDSRTDKRPELKTETEKQLESDKAEQQRASRAALPPKPPKKGTLRDDLKCSFCTKSPAKEVERSGATFYVCEEHTRKRKPPENDS